MTFIGILLMILHINRNMLEINQAKYKEQIGFCY